MNLFCYPPTPVSHSYQEDEIWVSQHLWRALQNTHIHDLAGGLSLPALSQLCHLSGCPGRGRGLGS